MYLCLFVFFLNTTPIKKMIEHSSINLILFIFILSTARSQGPKLLLPNMKMESFFFKTRHFILF